MKILGFTIWPFSHIAAISTFDAKKAKPINYSPSLVVGGFLEFAESAMRSVVIWMIVYLTNSIYPVA